MKRGTDSPSRRIAPRMPVVRLDLPPGWVLWETLLNLFPLVEEGSIVLEVDSAAEAPADLVLVPCPEEDDRGEGGRLRIRMDSARWECCDGFGSRCLAPAWEVAPAVQHWARAWRDDPPKEPGPQPSRTGGHGPGQAIPARPG